VGKVLIREPSARHTGLMQAERLIFLCWNVLSWTRCSPFQRLSVIKWKPEFGSWSAAVLLLSPPAHFLQSGPLQPPQVLAWDSPPTVPLGLSPLFPPPSTLPPLSTASYRCLSPFVLTLTNRTPQKPFICGDQTMKCNEVSFFVYSPLHN